MRINALLDAVLRRHDEIMATAAIFNKLLEQGQGVADHVKQVIHQD